MAPDWFHYVRNPPGKRINHVIPPLVEGGPLRPAWTSGTQVHAEQLVGSIHGVAPALLGTRLLTENSLRPDLCFQAGTREGVLQVEADAAQKDRYVPVP